jgi:hypothetical protein
LHLFGDMTSFLFYNRKGVKALSRGFCDKSGKMSLGCSDVGGVACFFFTCLDAFDCGERLSTVEAFVPTTLDELEALVFKSRSVLSDSRGGAE